jgi:tetratricopeptide (TPR) repeat protein
MVFIKNRNTRALILIMCALVSIGAAISWYYYRNVNRSVDPRTVKARTLYAQYDGYAQHDSYDSIFMLMDSIESVYCKLDHYRSSYETGVLHNNRAAAWLAMALYEDTDPSILTEKDSLVGLAEASVRKSIQIYETWMAAFQDQDPDEIRQTISADFLEGLEQYDAKSKERFLEGRIKEIQDAQIESQRRLSVSYTNLGIIYRFREQYDSAATCYVKAIDLWDRNLTAENNLNVLLGKPLKKRNFLQRMFPPERN